MNLTIRFMIGSSTVKIHNPNISEEDVNILKRALSFIGIDTHTILYGEMCNVQLNEAVLDGAKSTTD